MRGTRIAAVAACNLSFGVADIHALEVERVDSGYRDKQYQLTLDIVLDAPSDRVQAILRDYRSYPRLDARILEAEIVSRTNPHELLLYTKLRACFGVFCKNVKRVERVLEADNDLRAAVLPEQSEVLRGDTHTRLTPLDGRTRIVYVTSIAPGFWIPAFVGRPLMLRTLRDASIELFRNVERQAQSGVP
jgi:hypothetical protein